MYPGNCYFIETFEPGIGIKRGRTRIRGREIHWENSSAAAIDEAARRTLYSFGTTAEIIRSHSQSEVSIDEAEHTVMRVFTLEPGYLSQKCNSADGPTATVKLSVSILYISFTQKVIRVSCILFLPETARCSTLTKYTRSAWQFNYRIVIPSGFSLCTYHTRTMSKRVNGAIKKASQVPRPPIVR